MLSNDIHKYTFDGNIPLKCRHNIAAVYIPSATKDAIFHLPSKSDDDENSIINMNKYSERI